MFKSSYKTNNDTSYTCKLRHVRSIPSLIKWTGSKRSQANEIADLVPPYKRYIEPFLGGGAMLYLLGHPGAIVNDIYEPLIDLWKIVRDDPESLVLSYSQEWHRLNKELDRLDYDTIIHSSRVPRVFYEVRDRFNQSPNAYDLNFLMRTCVNGIVRFNINGEYNNSFHLSRRGMSPLNFSNAVKAWHSVLQGVDMMNKDYMFVLGNASKGDFVYLDPPYAGNKQRYSRNLDPKELFKHLDKLNSKGVKWALSFDGKRGMTDLTHDVPAELYKRHIYIHSGNSAVKKVLNGSIEHVEEALYLNY